MLSIELLSMRLTDYLVWISFLSKKNGRSARMTLTPQAKAGRDLSLPLSGDAPSG